MTGDKKITIDDILYLTNGGKDIYEKYIGKVSRVMKSPWRRDRTPSFGVFLYNGAWFFKDLGDENSGNAINFVEKLFGLSYSDAVDKIRWDFQMTTKKVAEIQHIVKDSRDVEMEPKKPKHISVGTIPFQKRHHDFWNCVEVSEDWCKKYSCYAVGNASVDYQRYYISPNEAVFAYYAEEENKWKLYFPDRKGMQRFRNNISYHYLHGYEKLPAGTKLVIQKSPKDMIVTALLQPRVIATQAEHLKIFDEDTVKRITDVADEIYISYGSDPDGKKKSINISKAFDWKWVNPPNEYLPDVNDMYSLVKKYGLKEMETLFKIKNII